VSLKTFRISNKVTQAARGLSLRQWSVVRLNDGSFYYWVWIARQKISLTSANGDGATMDKDVVEQNLAVVNAHFKSELVNEIEDALDLYTDDVIWESPARRVTLQGKSEAAANYHRMFGSMEDLRLMPLRRFATSDRVVDESLLTFRLSGEGVVNAPLGVGTTVESHMVHIFELRDGKIARESVYESWRDVSAPRFGAAGSARQPAESQRLSAEGILQLGLGFWGSKTLLSAVELGVFTELARGPLDGITLAGRLGLHQRSFRDFFDALVALGMLERRGLTYSNSAQTDFFLDRVKPSYIGGILEMANDRLYPFWGSLTEGLRTGLPQNEAKRGGNLFQALYSDPEALRGFLQAMTGLSMGSSEGIASKFPWGRYKTFADIGTAQGATPVQVALAHPHLSGIGYDLPSVRPIFEEYVRSFGLSERLGFQEGNFFTDPLPPADVILMGHILHDWDLEEKKMLIAKAYAALPSGGAFIVFEGLIDDDRRQNASGLLMSLNMLIETPGGFDYTGADCSQWMRQAGFRETRVEHLDGPNSMVVGTK